MSSLYEHGSMTAETLFRHPALHLQRLPPADWWQLACSRRRQLESLSKRLSAVLGHLVPTRPQTLAGAGAGTLLLWDGPGRWLLRGPWQPPPGLEGIEAVDISHSLAGVRVSGDLAAALLATGCPLDLEAESLAAPACARSLYLHLPLLLLRLRPAELELHVPASYLAELVHGLTGAAAALTALADR